MHYIINCELCFRCIHRTNFDFKLIARHYTVLASVLLIDETCTFQRMHCVFFIWPMDALCDTLFSGCANHACIRHEKLCVAMDLMEVKVRPQSIGKRIFLIVKMEWKQNWTSCTLSFQVWRAQCMYHTIHNMLFKLTWWIQWYGIKNVC